MTSGLTSSVLDLFPAGARRDPDGAMLVGGVRLDALAERFGTPALVVDEAALRAQAARYRAAFSSRWPRSDVAFASKAFPCTAIQRVMVQEGLHLDVAGGGEIVTALAAGADPARLILHGNAKTTEELELAIRAGVGTIVVDNHDDLDRLEQLVPPGRVQGCLVRVVPDVEASTHASMATGHTGSKFGLAPAEAARAIARIGRSSRLRMDGLHAHIGSQVMSADQLAGSVAPLARLGAFDTYDLGGGLGVRYTYTDQPATVEEYAQALVERARQLLPAGARLIVEPGRSVVAAAACTLYRVTTVKRGARTHVAVDGGMGDNLEYSLSGQRFEAALAGRESDRERSELVSVVGRHCESGDVLVDGVRLDQAQVGDLLALPVTGAYCYTMSNQYNGARRIPVVFVDAGEARLVVRRDTWDDLLSRDVEPGQALPVR
jgi:diaminopimelate decarboxylase